MVRDSMIHDPFQLPDIFRFPPLQLCSSGSFWSVDPIEIFSTKDSAPPGFLPSQQPDVVFREQDRRIQEVVSPLFFPQEIVPEVEVTIGEGEGFEGDVCEGEIPLPLFVQTPDVELPDPLARRFPMPFMSRMEGIVPVPFFPFHASIWTVSTSFPPFWTRILRPWFFLPSPIPFATSSPSPSEAVNEEI